MTIAAGLPPSRPCVVLLVGMLAAACQRDSVEAERVPAPVAGPLVRELPPARTVVPRGVVLEVTDVRTDPTVDAAAIRTFLHRAEVGLLACLDADQSTGTLVLRFPLERDGSVREITEAPGSNYGSDAARDCIGRLLGAMRYPVARAGRPSIEVTFEVRPR